VNDNDTTLQSYEENVQKYVDGTPHGISGDVKQWIDQALSYLSKGSTILELGSGFGRDAVYIEAKGYKVERTDAAKAFVELMQSQGQQAKVLNAIADDYGGLYAMVYANAVLLHFEPAETKQVLAKIYSSLESNGILAFTVKEGEGESWSEEKLNAPRYFCYWQESDLRQTVEEAGFTIIELTKGSTRNSQWLQVIAKKSA
jgi:predicted TPR repeat methyltransferase